MEQSTTWVNLAKLFTLFCTKRPFFGGVKLIQISVLFCTKKKRKTQNKFFFFIQNNLMQFFGLFCATQPRKLGQIDQFLIQIGLFLAVFLTVFREPYCF